MQKKLILAATAFVVLSTQASAHGWQISPLSRTEDVFRTDIELLGYNPDGVLNFVNKPGGSYTYAQIKSYTDSGGYGSGPLAFYKRYHKVRDNYLCSNGDGDLAPNGAKVRDALLYSVPESHVVQVSNNQTIKLTWLVTVPHTASHFTTFITNYSAGHYNPRPTWNDLVYLPECDLDFPTQGMPMSSKYITHKGGTNLWGNEQQKEGYEVSWSCKIAIANHQLSGKQVMVSIWQRVDPEGENFLSCTDLNFSGNSVPVESTPIESTPIESTPIESTPIESTPEGEVPGDQTAPAPAPVASGGGCTAIADGSDYSLVLLLASSALYAYRRRKTKKVK